MAYLAWKQSIGEGNVGPERAKELLRNFNYSTSIDKKGRLLINAGFSKFVLGFKENGNDSTYIGVNHFKMNPGAFIGFIILICLFVIPGAIFSLVINSQRKKVFIEAAKLMNQNLMTTPRVSSTTNTASKLEDLKAMKDKGLISAEEFEAKKKDIIEKM